MLLLALAAVAAVAAPAADPAANAVQSALPPALFDSIDAALTALPRKHDLDADQRKQAEELLRDALADDQHASESVAQLQTYRAATEQVRSSAQQPPAAPKNLGAALADWQAKLPHDASIEQLSELLEQERNLLTTAQDSLRTVEDGLQKQTQRPDALRDDLAKARIESVAPATPAAGTPATLAEAMRLRAQAATRLQRCQLATLEMEQRSYEPRVRALFAQRSDRRRDVDEHGQRVHLLENMLLDRYNSQVSDQVGLLAQEKSKLATDQATPVLQDTAATTLNLGNELVATIKRIGVLRDLKNTYTSDRSETEQAVKNTTARIELGGVSEEVGALLLAERRKLKSLTALNRGVADLRNEQAQTKLELMDLREEQDSLENTDTAIATLLQSAGQLPVLTGDLHDALARLLSTRSDVLTRLIAAKSRQSSLLDDTVQQLSGLATSTAELSKLLDSHLLGTPSHSPITLSWFSDFGHSLRALWQAQNKHPLQTFVDSFRQAGTFLPGLAALTLIAAILMRRWVPGRFSQMAAPMRRIRSDGYRFTLQALALTVIAAAPIALMWTLLGRILLHTSRLDPMEGSLGFATNSVAIPWYVLAFLYWLNREDGLAHLHFRWPRVRRAALRRAVPWLALSILLPLFMHTWLREISSDETDATMGRALFIGGAMGLAALAWRLLRPGAVWTQRGNAGDEPNRTRQIARLAFSGIFLVIAMLAVIGYFFTALTLAEHILASLAALLAASVLQGLAVRWLMLGERRLALKRAEERQAAQQQSAGEQAGGEVLPEVEAEERTVADLSAQTRRVLRLAILILFGASLLMIWSDIAPALTSFLDAQVWQSSDTGSDGKAIALKVSVGSVLEAFLILAMTWVGTRNLPGLLEIGVLRRLSMDAPTRYAVTSVVRYLIVLVGTLFGVSLLGVHWSNLQWLAAGLTVGLGFGLQEIFGNFISGLIVLFERPCRVGDIITIGNVEGTVTRIRTRATTILDWDNKEVIVPNKNFITERLVNWTLSDSVTRVVIKVGIAYRNDPQLARKLLLEIASGHDAVLADPPPTAWMTGFGESTQDFELRIYVAEINQRNPVRTDLQIRIAEVFRDNDMELAFPTRDVWFRNALETKVSGRTRPGGDDETGQALPSADAINASKRD